MFSATMTGPETENTDPCCPSLGPSLFFDAIVCEQGDGVEADRVVLLPLLLLLALGDGRLEFGLEFDAGDRE